MNSRRSSRDTFGMGTYLGQPIRCFVRTYQEACKCSCLEGCRAELIASHFTAGLAGNQRSSTGNEIPCCATRRFSPCRSAGFASQQQEGSYFPASASRGYIRKLRAKQFAKAGKVARGQQDGKMHSPDCDEDHDLMQRRDISEQVGEGGRNARVRIGVHHCHSRHARYLGPVLQHHCAHAPLLLRCSWPAASQTFPISPRTFGKHCGPSEWVTSKHADRKQSGRCPRTCKHHGTI